MKDDAASRNTAHMDPSWLKDRIANSAFAFRGYNVTNLGRSHDLLRHSDYEPFVRPCLERASEVYADVTGRRADLVARVDQQQETTLETYGEAIALIMAMEKAQVDILRELFDIELASAKWTLGYSLGEISAVALGGVIDLYEAMRVPLLLAEDCAELASDVSLGVLFSRGRSLPLADVKKLCLEINLEGQGVIDVSAHLSPNSFLLMGQRDTLGEFKRRMKDVLPGHTNLRKSNHRFPPLHTSITWQRGIPNRAALAMQTLAIHSQEPSPQVLSLVTGATSYNEYNARDTLHQWVDHPQRLWDVVYETLKSNVDTIVHVGPEPNIIPATYKRLGDNVEAETKGKVGMRALKAVVHHPWLKSLLPKRTALLRAPKIEQLVLEDWLLEQRPAQ